MSFKLTELKNVSPLDLEERSKDKGTERAAEHPAKQPKTSSSPKRVEDTIRIPLRIDRFVIYRTYAGNVEMRYCKSIDAAEEWKNKIEGGYVGN